MPEIAEVALTAEILNKKLRGKHLTEMKFVGGRYQREKPEGYRRLVRSLPMKIKSVQSQGKFLWFHLKNDDTEWYIWNTFGLTGGWTFADEVSYAKCQLTTDAGQVATYYDARNFGTFKLSQDREALDAKLVQLSPDLLKDDFDFKGVVKYAKPIVSILMDQKKVGSGIGNYLVAEILYRAKISPFRLGTEMTPAQIKRLVYWTKYVIKLSYLDNQTEYMIGLVKDLGRAKKFDYHPEVEIDDNDHFQFQVYSQETDPKGNPVEKASIVKGRTTWWVPAVQK